MIEKCTLVREFQKWKLDFCHLFLKITHHTTIVNSFWTKKYICQSLCL